MNNYHLKNRTVTELAAWIRTTIQPDTYVVVHLKRSVDGVPGTIDRYNEVATKYLARVSRKALGARYRRLPPGKRLIPNAVTFEGGTDHPHLNILVQRPKGMDQSTFAALLKTEWTECPWSKPETDAFYCKPFEADRDAIGYSLKDGTEALLIRSLSHHSH